MGRRMSRAPRIVVTREAADADAVVDALEREGFDGWVVPDYRHRAAARPAATRGRPDRLVTV